ncbi:hypothetical protein P3G55_04755 [Leptospira sp. 96542]|nr:hypothetical protein [Leptospira sp. 96542]
MPKKSQVPNFGYLEGSMLASIRFPLFLSLVFFSVNFVFCSFSHRENKEGLFRVGDSVIRYTESLETPNNTETVHKTSPFDRGVL